MRVGRVLVTAVGVAVAGGLGVAPGAGAAAGAGGACRGEEGVTVVVDFSAFDGPIAVRCAQGDPASGLAALSDAGFSYGFVRNYPGLICQIDALPSPCNGAPADAYWNYSTAEAGGTWNYSNMGAGFRDPAPGTVEGWAFGGDVEPGIAPPSTPATTVPPATTIPATSPAPAPAPPGSAPSSGSGAVGDASAIDSAGEAATTTSSTSAPGAVDGQVTGVEGLDGLDRDSTDRDPAAGSSGPGRGELPAAGQVAIDGDGDGDGDGDEENGAGGLTGPVVGLGVVGSVAAAGVILARRRSNEDSNEGPDQ